MTPYLKLLPRKINRNPMNVANSQAVIMIIMKATGLEEMKLEKTMAVMP